MTSTGSVPNVQEILLTFATEGEPTPKRLEAFSKEYPEYRRELTSLAVDLVLDPSRQVQPADASTTRNRILRMETVSSWNGRQDDRRRNHRVACMTYPMSSRRSQVLFFLSSLLG